MTWAVEADDLRKTYPGGVEAVRGVSFKVSPGEVFGLLGPNGAGKSTTIGMLTTTVEPTSGVALLGGYDVRTHPLEARSVSSVVFQDAVVDQALTGTRNLELHGRLWGVPAAGAERRIAELAEVFGLAGILKRPVRGYSGGQRRRLEIARALLSNPQILFLDEPTVGLDTRIRYELLDLISGLRSRTGMATVLTTHYLDEAERLCDRVAIVHHGAIVALDAPSLLLEEFGTEILELRISDDPRLALDKLRTANVAGDTAFAVGSTLTIPLHRPASSAMDAVLQLDIRTESVTTRRPTLDDIYLQLTGTSLAA